MIDEQKTLQKAAEILELVSGARDLPESYVDVPEWGIRLKLRGLTGAQRGAFERKLVKFKGDKTKINTKNMREDLISRCVIDETGNLVFSQADISMLAGKSSLAISRLFKAAKSLSGMDDDALEEAEKNSSNSLEDDFPSD